MELETKYQVILKDDTEFGTFQDAMYFPIGGKPSATELKRLAQQRVDNWVTSVKEASEKETVTIEIPEIIEG